jgi:hypothetical protein
MQLLMLLLVVSRESLKQSEPGRDSLQPMTSVQHTDVSNVYNAFSGSKNKVKQTTLSAANNISTTTHM